MIAYKYDKHRWFYSDHTRPWLEALYLKETGILPFFACRKEKLEWIKTE